MGETTLIHLSRMVALERKLDVIARNVANADSSGFQARELSFQEYLKTEKGTDETGNKQRPLSLVAPRLQFGNTAQGALTQTGNPLDLAIRGAGYLEVQTPQGNRYTRAGALTIDNNGRLVTLAGQPVLGKTGAIRIPADANDISVSADGVISTKRTVLGQLRVVGFARPELLRPVGDSLLQTDQAPFDLGSGKANIVSGALEKSNVETSREVNRLQEVVRSYEMVGRLLKSSQDVDDINRLGNVPD